MGTTSDSKPTSVIATRDKQGNVRFDVGHDGFSGKSSESGGYGDNGVNVSQGGSGNTSVSLRSGSFKSSAVIKPLPTRG
jgi:hypothetical protein